MLISTNKFKEFSQKALPLAIAAALGTGFYQAPAYAADVDLGIAKSADKTSAALNETVTYTLTVTNIGVSVTALATVTDILPAGLTYVSNTGGGTNTGQTVSWTVPALTVGASTVLTLTATVNSTLVATLSNTASVAAGAGDTDSNPANDSATANINVPTVSLSLCAVSGSTTLPATTTAGTVSVPVWGYKDCAGPSITAPGGPVLTVNQGDRVKITLTNSLTEPTALLFQGQDMVPDTTGVAAAGAKDYLFTATNPGTYLYEAGLLPNAKHQVAMGLYGALVVRPTGITLPTVPAGLTGQAYASADTAFHEEAVMVLSEIDTALNNRALATSLVPPATFDMRKFAPKYFLVNGKVYPNTDLIPSAIGHNVLLRYVNAGIKPHTMATLGLRQNIVGNDGSPITHPRNGVSETVAPGQTLDAIATVSATAALGSKFAVYDAGMNLNNSNTAGMGGMLTFVDLPCGGAATCPPAPGNPPGNPVPPGDTVGPVTTGVAMAPNPSNGTGTVALTATGNDTTTGNSNVTSATYSIDGGAATTMNPVGAAAPVRGFTANINASVLTEGTHPVTVTSTAPVAGLPSAAVNLVVDKTGPAVGIVTAAPSPTNGAIGVNSSTAAVRVTAPLTDVTSTVAAGEMFIDPVGAPALGSGIIMVPSDGNFNSATETGYADIPLGTILPLSNGNHTLSVRGKDAAGNWGALVTGTLLVDKLAPTISSATLTPNIRTFALGVVSPLTLTVAGSDNVGGTGLNGGQYTIDGGAAIPFAGTSTSVATSTLTAGTHTLSARVKDAAGNLSASISFTLYVVSAVNNTYTVNANTSIFPQIVNVNTANGVLTNDQPTGVAGRTATIVAGSLQRIDNNNGTGASAGTGTIGVTLNANGSFSYTLTAPVSANTNALRQNAKRGHYSFTYTETLNGVISAPATVTITVN
jgi:uncharacterized repeat protein (TIGR01451 family)